MFTDAKICHIQSLPPYFEVWEKLARKTASLVEDGTLRAEIQKMPFLHHEHLQSHKELRLAHTCLTALVHGYVWMAGEQNIVSSIPMNLAIPVCGVSERLGIDPALRHYTFVLNNWTLRDRSKKLELSNVETIIKVRGGEDESWFFMVALQMELDAAPGVCAIVRAQQAVKGAETKVLKDCLMAISASISQVELALKRMHEQCRPDVFYGVLRPFFNGWDSTAFKSKGLQGLIYEGVSPHPRVYAGGSGAQSAILFAFDAALGVTQSNSGYKMFFNMLCPAHKQFVETTRNGPSIQSYGNIFIKT
ncbi:indoleamine 2,3-dioxygenase 2-like isoform X2 [Anneissia japonica]|uniref:indoleamine 2,3-dioxygenase 2-like isoform X2 n=1 Tax=Anneissia japonica TaxID=1529436 RepID=UPI001425A283|nr:indoleamine 2,3-dioxygenase 2-like isoform X2 [Anneissia japonica]